jgi:hypothetical protein
LRHTGPGIDVADCVSRNPDKLSACSFPAAPSATISAAQMRAVTGLRGVHAIDLNSAICPGDQCAAVIGDVLIYRDTNHITATYSASLSSLLNTAVQGVLDAPTQSH